MLQAALMYVVTEQHCATRVRKPQKFGKDMYHHASEAKDQVTKLVVMCLEGKGAAAGCMADGNQDELWCLQSSRSLFLKLVGTRAELGFLRR